MCVFLIFCTLCTIYIINKLYQINDDDVESHLATSVYSGYGESLERIAGVDVIRRRFSSKHLLADMMRHLCKL